MWTGLPIHTWEIWHKVFMDRLCRQWLVDWGWKNRKILKGKKTGTFVHMLRFNFTLVLNFISFCFKLTIIHYHNQKQQKIKLKPRIKLSHNTPQHIQQMDERETTFSAGSRAWDKGGRGGGGGPTKVPINNGPSEALPFTLKIEVSIVLQLAW